MTITIYTIPLQKDLDIKQLYIDDSILTESNYPKVEIANAWWWTDQLFKDNEIINAELRGSYLIYKRLAPEDKPEYCDNKQYNAIDTIFSDFNFERFDYILKCTW